MANIKKYVQKIALVILIGVSAYGYIKQNPESTDTSSPAQVGGGDSALMQAFKNKQSDLQIEGSGRVVKVLPDDLEGSRHQKFIVKLSSGQTLLVSHNIDLAPRVEGIKSGDNLEFYGEYEWSRKGGVVHWTHHDPRGRHPDGWLRHKGRTYQ